MSDFVSPGELCSLSSFTAEIAAPIHAGRQPDAGAAERERADHAAERLRERTEPYVLRRDASVLKALLPDRHELAVFVPLLEAQAAAYRHIIKSGAAEEPLRAINQLRAVCSCGDGSAAAGGNLDDDAYLDEATLGHGGPRAQGGGAACAAARGVTAAEGIAKTALLMRLLEPVRAAGEQVVICSNFRRSLDVVQSALSVRGWGALRLDGQTPMATRQGLVDRFNSRGATDSFAFLLSTRAVRSCAPRAPACIHAAGLPPGHSWGGLLQAGRLHSNRAPMRARVCVRVRVRTGRHRLQSRRRVPPRAARP